MREDTNDFAMHRVPRYFSRVTILPMDKGPIDFTSSFLTPYLHAILSFLHVKLRSGRAGHKK